MYVSLGAPGGLNFVADSLMSWRMVLDAVARSGNPPMLSMTTSILAMRWCQEVDVGSAMTGITGCHQMGCGLREEEKSDGGLTFFCGQSLGIRF